MKRKKNIVRGRVFSRNKLAIGILGVGLISSLGVITFNYFDKYESPFEKENDKQIAMYIEGDSGEYEISSSNTFPTAGYVLNLEKSSCKNGGILSQDPITKKLRLSLSDQDSCTVYFDKEKTPAEKTLAALKLTSNGVRTDFDIPATTDEGIFEMADDYGTSYYYRGAVTNNYVKFAGFYWRIIRINGDGSVRIIYDGTQGWLNGTGNDNRFAKVGQPFNTNYDDTKYVGWMYGPENAVEGTTTASTSKKEAQTNTVDSDIKNVVDKWYKENIEDNGYGQYVSDTLFCNDRSFANDNTGTGFGTSITYYGAYGRMKMNVSGYTGIEPNFECLQQNDAFTVNDTAKGNGALTYPVGLITADEIVAAGSGKYNENNLNYYLYKTNNYYMWTLSPYGYYSASYIFITNTSGQLNGGFWVNDTKGAVAPVINLSATYASALIGTGIMTDPYRAPNVTP